MYFSPDCPQVYPTHPLCLDCQIPYPLWLLLKAQLEANSATKPIYTWQKEVTSSSARPCSLCLPSALNCQRVGGQAQCLHQLLWAP